METLLLQVLVPGLRSILPRAFGNGPLNYSSPVEAAVLRLVKTNNFTPEIIFWDDGNQISIVTSSALDSTGRKLVAGGVRERWFLVCEVQL
ncbi:Major facilitator superfamily domain general substrate transporter [Penicillium expansum]|nr:Major facilitator superfamily domain general substrate transporter [Penicillium expansum]